MQTRGGGIGLRKGSSRMEDYALILTKKKTELSNIDRGEWRRVESQQYDPYLLQKTCSVGLCHCSILLVSLQKPTSSARETTPETSLIDYIYELQISPYFPNKGTGSRGEKEWPYKMTLLKSMSGSPFKMG